MFPRHTNNILFFITSSFGCKGNEKEQDVQKKECRSLSSELFSCCEKTPLLTLPKNQFLCKNDYNEPNKRLKMEK
jgi:hypothetical protein